MRAPALVLVPGLAATSRYFDPVVAGLTADHPVTTMDLPGHGRTDPPAEATLAGAADRLRRLIEDLGHDRVVLLGWSLGATVAYTYLERHGTDRVAALISVEQTPRLLADGGWPHSVFGGLDSVAAAELLQRIETDPDAFTDTVLNNSFAAGSTPDPGLLRSLQAEAATCDPRSMRDLLADGLAADWRTRVTKITLPTLLVHGTRSLVYPTPVGRWLAGAFPRARLVEFEESGHLPFLEETGKFLDTVRDFIKKEATA